MAGVKGSVVCSVVLAADWFTVGVVVDVEETFEQLPSLLGRQLEHCFPAFTQAQPLHEPVLLHLQQSTISRVIISISTRLGVHVRACVLCRKS